MDKKTTLMYGALLHDIGKIIYRSNHHSFTKGTHSKLGAQFLKQFPEFNQKDILESVAYHHYKELYRAKLSHDSNAYITYIADNIASGIDRRDDVEEGNNEEKNQKFSFDKSTPLYSVFNIINEQQHGKTEGKLKFENEKHLSYPVEQSLTYTNGVYTKLLNDMTEDFRNKLKFQNDFFPSMLQWSESLWQFVPSSTNTNQLIDISLYDHSRITCAIAACIYDYLSEKEVTDYKSELFANYNKTKAFYQTEAFVLLSMDMSGIQDFIYNISGNKALKSLRSRSFYLEIMLEVIVDQLLDNLQLSRANLLYTGGGHAYLILPNTEKLKKEIKNFHNNVKNWLMKEFIIDLSLSIAYEPCTGEDLMNSNGKYKDIWRNLSQKLSDEKSHKYNAGDIKHINKLHTHGDRECKECLRSDTKINDEGLCSVCAGIINISNDLRDKSFFILSQQGKLKMPFDLSLSVVDYHEAESLAKKDSSIRIYSKNKPFVGSGIATNLWMCDYDYASTHSETIDKGIGNYVIRDKGIKRLGVVRADVDNLGQTFINGIPERYNSLSRTATLSRQLSLFFKYELNLLLEGYQVTAIYSGGDDLFLIGAWDDIIQASIKIREHFTAFTLGKLSISAGIGLFPAKYPISKMAFETGMLEENAKTGDKNQVTLWTSEKVYLWDVLKNDILMEKLSVIEKGFENTDEHGKAFIYKILELLRDNDAINIARMAYLLARSKMDNTFSNQIFEWAQNSKDKETLITALEIYIYQIREVN
ncbi:type III-A CRISPR-associated protein Cas10/Csm1 [Staphylococcus chromogenes]|uniref:type III-A CRISPR-associated protein Cas10/Csm1 n=1 Tax=Staphylococcus chromogenes TaxID=46126 RepID=UPI0028855291|nr:type III-A CRISPR-associated protein Cas10/Csm1 [Staphylococcus chromogenes]MDT0740574.1 type III-A CRISPR-associated protein Cas10/Csm1 [Staphylococcus chromogenes]